MVKILWLAPNINHYKARLLNHLANEIEINLTVLCGTGRDQMGDKELQGPENFKRISVKAPKKYYGKSKLVRDKIKSIYTQFDWVMIPAEKKNILLFLYLLKLRNKHRTFRLFSYNHPIFNSGNGKILIIDVLMTKFYFKRLDRVVFYTEGSSEWAIKNKLISQNKAYWVNNTLDTIEIKKHYSYQLPPENPINILFIGRLIQSKRIPDLIKYFLELKKHIPNLKLDIIGDGPIDYLVKSAIISHRDITWHGTMINESKISPLMKKASLVFIPGHSGLSINHAFAYGRPYITLVGPSHAPELEYINSGVNGYILDNDFESNINTIVKLLTDKTVLNEFCNQAKIKGSYLSIQNWVKQMRESLLDDTRQI